MKKTIRTVALFAGLSLVAVGCQKEDINKQSFPAGNQQAYINASYTIDDVAMHATFSDEKSWQEFLHWMVGLAEEGHRVSLGNDAVVRSMTKETVTFVTNSQSEAEAWCDRMFKKGYQVSIEYDVKTQTYFCEAVR